MFRVCPNFYSKAAVFALITVLVTVSYVNGGSVNLTAENFNQTVASHELVFVDFFEARCYWSSRLAPIWEESADKVRELFPEPSRVIMAKVNCSEESELAVRFEIRGYPTVKLIRNGQVTEGEYEGEADPEAFVDYLERQLEYPVNIFRNISELSNSTANKSTIIGYFDKRDGPEYKIFHQVATNLTGDCQFYIGFGVASSAMHPPGTPVIDFRSKKAMLNGTDETYKGSLNNFDELNTWAREKCVPQVPAITGQDA